MLEQRMENLARTVVSHRGSRCTFAHEREAVEKHDEVGNAGLECVIDGGLHLTLVVQPIWIDLSHGGRRRQERPDDPWTLLPFVDRHGYLEQSTALGRQIARETQPVEPTV